MPQTQAGPVNGLCFRLAFFDFVFMLGEFLSALSELHVKLQLIDRYSSKVLHNLRLLDKQRASGEQVGEYIRKENQQLVMGLERQNIFYDKYRLKMLRILHEGAGGELLVEDPYGGPQFAVQIKRVVSALLGHVFDSTPVQEMGLFLKEESVLRLTGSFDSQPGQTERKAILELSDAARKVHAYVKKEKLLGVRYLSSGRLVMDPPIIEQIEALETDKDRFLADPLTRALFGQTKVAAS